MERIKDNKTPVKVLNIYSDSEYSVKTFNVWLPNWIKKKKEYLNPDIIDEIRDHLTNAPFKVFFHHVRAHTGKDDPKSVANDIVDALAKKGAFRR